MMNRDFFPNVTEEFDERVRETLAALPEKRRRRMTAGKVAAIALAAALCLGGTALAASGGLFPLLFPDGGDAISGYAATPATPVAENEGWRLTVDSVLLDENSLTGVVSLRLENLKGDGKMPFKIANLFPEYQNQPGMSWTAFAETYANEDGECSFAVINENRKLPFNGPFYLDTERSTENVYYLEAALIGYGGYAHGDTLTLGMYQHGTDGALLSVTLPEPKAMPSVSSGDGEVTLSQIGLRVELDTSETAVDIDYVALRMTDGGETVIIDDTNHIDRTLYIALGTASDPSEGSTENVATYLLAAAPELENVRSVVINDIEYQLA